MKNIEKITTLAIVLLVLSIPMVYATSSHASIKVSVSGGGDANAHSIATASDGGSADAVSEATASDGGSASANARADASGPESTASAIVKATNEDRDCQAIATGGNTDTCITGIGNIAVTGETTDTATGNVAVTQNIVEKTSTSSSGDMSIASSEDDSGEPVVIPDNVVTISGYDNVLIIG